MNPLVELAWGDLGADLFGLARLGPGGAEAVLLHHGARVEVRDRIAVPEPGGSGRLALGDLGALDLVPAGAPVELGGAATGGVALSVALCSLRGRLDLGDRRVEVDALGELEELRGEPDGGEHVVLMRRVSAWLGDSLAVTLRAARPARARQHADEAVAAAILPSGDVVADPRLSTTYGPDGLPSRAGIELWVGEGEEEHARRAAGQVLRTLQLERDGTSRSVSFLRWTMEGAAGPGRYELRRAALGSGERNAAR